MNSWVLITGATGGLGKAFATECAARGWNLVMTDLKPAPLETLAGGLQKAYNVDVRCYTSDLTSPASRAQLFDTFTGERMRFWMVINVAGLDFEGSFYEQPFEKIRTIIRLNIEGTLEVTHALMQQRDPVRTFRIINVASLAAFYPMPVKATYAASKRFLLDFSLALREELRDVGVTVTALCPAGMPTTPECIESIESQGWMGALTTQNTGSVAAGTIDSALKGKAVYIPGVLNRILQALGGIVPAPIIAWIVGERWRLAHERKNARRRLVAATQS